MEVLIAATIVGAPLAGAALVGAIGASPRLQAGIAPLSIAAVGVSLALTTWLWTVGLRPLFWRTGWLDTAGIGIGLYVDDLSLLFALLAAVMSLLSMLYSVQYIPYTLEAEGIGHRLAAYYGYMLLFTGAMFGLVFASDLIQLYVFWELTSIASFLLIGLAWHDPAARSGAVRALSLTALGGIALLVGLLVFAMTVQTYSLPEALARQAAMHDTPASGTVLLLVLLGAATKSAQVPFHIWLPDAMVAPTPVSAFLHSATLVAAGVYLLARVHPVFAADPLWQWSVTGVGTISMLTGGILALRQRQFKALLAYSTVSQYGVIFALLGYGSRQALGAALFYFLLHGLIKGGLFFALGVVTYATGVRELGRGSGLWARFPAIALITALLALSLGGVPPLAGFWMKELFLRGTLEIHVLPLTALAVAGSALTFAYMLRLLDGAFISGAPSPSRLRATPVTMLIAPGALAVLSALAGLWPEFTGAALIEPAARAVIGETLPLDLALHLDLTLALSGLTLGLGAFSFATYRRWSFLLAAVTRPVWSVNRCYAGIADAVLALGRTLLRLQNGSLHRYLLVSLLAFLGLMAGSLAGIARPLVSPGTTGGWPFAVGGPRDGALALLLLFIVVGSVLTFTVWRHSHMVLALSTVGYLIAGVFALELAPDVGLVQVHVETLVTVLLILALVLIPHQIRQSMTTGPRSRLSWMPAGLAVASGLGAFWLSWEAMDVVPAAPIAPWFIEHAYGLAHANDVVAAILVDFRALDTLGEITVFAIAALGVYALMRLVRRGAE